jgi:hypothetical protein
MIATEIQFLEERTQRGIVCTRPFDRSIDLTHRLGALSCNWWGSFHAHWSEANRAPCD